jgi:hypothetical protein
MKNINNILCVCMLALLVSCQKDYVEPDKFSDVSFVTSFFRSPSSSWGVSTGQLVTFSDLSQGALTHKWQLLTDSCVFLVGQIAKTDTVFDKYRIAGTESSLKTLNVLYLKDGIQKIRLYNTYADSVTYRAGSSSARLFYPSKKIGNVWVVDTTLVVHVYASQLKNPKLVLNYNGVDLPANSDTVYVKKNSSLNLTDFTPGSPNVRNYTFKGTSTGTVPMTANPSYLIITFPMKFTALGVYNNNSMTISRTADVGNNIPAATNSLIVPIPNVIKVIP